MRCADFGPTPGKPPELVDQGLDRPFVDRHRGSAEQPAEAAAQCTRGRVPAVAAPSFCCCSSWAWRLASVTAATHEVLERLDVVGVDDARVDRDRAQLAVCPSPCLHHAATDGRLDASRSASAACAACMSCLHLLDLLTSASVAAGSATVAPRCDLVAGAFFDDLAPRSLTSRATESGGGSVVGRVDELVEVDRRVFLVQVDVGDGVGAGGAAPIGRSASGASKSCGRSMNARLEPELRARTRP